MTDCPYCKNKNCYEEWQEQEYENLNDPTPEYGGKLQDVDIDKCEWCDCEDNIVKGVE
jgi:hypothetical protein